MQSAAVLRPAARHGRGAILDGVEAVTESSFGAFLTVPLFAYHVRRSIQSRATLTPRSDMKITASAVSLNVENVPASAGFLTNHFGFREQMAADGFASLAHEDSGLNVVFLRRGLSTLPADQRDDHARGVILAFTVENLDDELARLQAEGVAITMPLTEEEWGERAFQVRDPNGVIVQLVDWNGSTS